MGYHKVSTEKAIRDMVVKEECVVTGKPQGVYIHLQWPEETER